MTDQQQDRADLAECLRGIADMTDDLIELLECGCNVCLWQVQRNLAEQADELYVVLTEHPGARLLDVHGMPPPGRHTLESLSAHGLRSRSATLRLLADRTEAGVR